MTRAAAKAAPVAANGHFTGPDGREYVSIDLGKHRTFARACLDALVAAGEPSKHWLLRNSKAVSVPVDILDAARKTLGPQETPEEYAE